MAAPRYLLAILLLSITGPAQAQVAESFADGEFATAPTWTGNTSAWRTSPSGSDYALQSNGAAAPDTIYLATPSHVAFGKWSFTFSYDVNLSNFNGARVFLVSDADDLTGALHGYYVQLGTNNTDEVRLYRQDGDPSTRRVELGRSTAPLLAPDHGTHRIEVTRDDAGTWSLAVDGAQALRTFDRTYTTGSYFGLWVKHSTSAARSYTFDDLTATFTDNHPPHLYYAEETGTDTITVYFDEDVDPRSASHASFRIGAATAQHVQPVSARAWQVIGDMTSIGKAGEAMLHAEGAADVAANPILPTDLVIARRPEPGDVALNEVLFAPHQGQPEYLEIYNRRDHTLALRGLFRTRAPDETGDADTLHLAPGLAALPPHGFAVIYPDTAIADDPAHESNLARAFPNADLAAPSVTLVPLRRASLSLRNTGDLIRIHRRDSIVLDEVTYDPAWHNPSLYDATGISLERISPDAPANAPENWGSSPDPYGGTPGRPNALSAAPAPETAGLTVHPSPFSPDADGIDDETAIRYTLPQPGGSIRIRIYDLRGRLVRTITPGDLPAPTGEYTWDGHDDTGHLLRIGIYIVVLDVVYPKTGKTALFKKPIVLARQLD